LCCGRCFEFRLQSHGHTHTHKHIHTITNIETHLTHISHTLVQNMVENHCLVFLLSNKRGFGPFSCLFRVLFSMLVSNVVGGSHAAGGLGVVSRMRELDVESRYSELGVVSR
jgi:hypothetical protein